MHLLVAFAFGAAYTMSGIYLASLAADMPASKLRTFIGCSVPRCVLVIILWPVTLSIAASHTHRQAMRSRSVQL